MLIDSEINVDTLPSFCRARVLILGVGNMLFGNDGFGPEVIDHLTRHYVIPDDIYAIDVGTGARKVLFTVSLSEIRPQEIVIVDAVDWGEEIGTVAQIPVESLPITKVDDFSLHQVPTSNLLRELQDDCAVTVTVIVCDVGPIAQVIQPGLSPHVYQSVMDACEQISTRFSLKRLQESPNI
ncbi:MAG TPA: hydrogenase maturation protease [Anaerolineales bacterium]|nr:hydrogenase maturation protease [Anaerolineales bacterium]